MSAAHLIIYYLELRCLHKQSYSPDIASVYGGNVFCLYILQLLEKFKKKELKRNYEDLYQLIGCPC